jgi:hypothetical protein
MPFYKCFTCGKSFNRKSTYDYHKYKKKVPCVDLGGRRIIRKTDHESQTSHTYKCPKCNKTYANKSNLNRHISGYCLFKSASAENNKNDYHHLKQVATNKTCESGASKSNNSSIGTYHHQRRIEIPQKTAFCDFGSVSNRLKNAEKPHNSKTVVRTFQCDYCLKHFARKDNLTRHIRNSCKVIKKDNEEKERIYQQLLKQMVEQNEQMKEQSEQIKQIIEENKQLKQQIVSNTTTDSHNTNCHNTNTTNNTQNNNTNNIQIKNEIKLVGFGKEDLYGIEDKVVKKLLHKGLNSVLETIRYTHFHKYNEKYHNVYVSNMKDIYAMIYDDHRNKWKLTNKKEVVDSLYGDKHLFLENKYEELYDELPPLTKKKFDRLLELSDDEETVGIIKKEILLMLYNDKEIPLKTRKKMEDSGMLAIEN